MCIRDRIYLFLHFLNIILCQLIIHNSAFLSVILPSYEYIILPDSFPPSPHLPIIIYSTFFPAKRQAGASTAYALRTSFHTFQVIFLDLQGGSVYH